MNAATDGGRTGGAVRRAMGIDLGDVRIGVALADGLGMLAHPYETIQVGTGQAQPKKGQPTRVVASTKGVQRIKEIAAKENIGVIVVGLPRNMDGTDGPAAAKARAFADAVRMKTGCEVRLLDERLTTVAAQKALQASGRNVKNSRRLVDQVAAQMILQTYLDGEALKKDFAP